MRSLLLLAAVLPAACSRQDRQDAPPTAGAPSPEAPAPAPRVVAPSKDVSGLVRRLRWEARHRPATRLTAEQIFDAVERAGLSVRGRRQYLGATVSASFCAGGTIGDGVALSVCEYPSPEAAERGRRLMESQFQAITPHAHRERHGDVVLTLAHGPDGEHGETVRRALTALRGLTSSR